MGSQSQPAHPVTHLRQVEDTGDDDGVDDDDDDDDDDDGDNIFTSDRNQVLSTSSGTFLHGARIFAEKNLRPQNCFLVFVCLPALGKVGSMDLGGWAAGKLAV